MNIGSEIEVRSEWMPAPIYRAPRHELDFGLLKISLDEEQLSRIRSTRAPLKLSLLTASHASSPVPIIAGFVLVDARTVIGSVGQQVSKQWYRFCKYLCILKIFSFFSLSEIVYNLYNHVVNGDLCMKIILKVL